MNKASSLLLTAFFIALSIAGYCASGDSLLINLTFKSKEIKQADDLKMTLTIKSHLRQTLYLPAVDLWGLPSSIDGFYIIQLQKRSGQRYVNLHIGGNIDNIPSTNTDRLHFGSEKELAFLLYMLCDFTKGEYRVRVLCKLSTLNKLSDRYSNWAYFTCRSNIPN